MGGVNQQQLQVIPSQNQLMVGGKGPLAARLNLDFTLQDEYDLDMQNAQSLNQFDLCQTIFIDNSIGGAQVKVTIPSSGQVIVAKVGSQGYYNVICPNPIQGLKFESAGGGVVVIFLINVAIPGSVWSAI